MRVNRQFILTRIDIAAQKEKQEKTKTGIFLPQQYVYMKYNLQHGPILQMGETAKRMFPNISIGDTVIFKHTIESEDWRVVDKVPNDKYPGDYFMKDELRLVDCRSGGREILGFLTTSGELIANDMYVWLNPAVTPIIAKSLSLLFTGEALHYWNNDEYLMRKLEENKLDMQNIRDTLPSITEAYKLEDTYKYLEVAAKYGESLTKMIHANKPCSTTIEVISEKTSAELGLSKGNTVRVCDYKMLYPLNIFDKEFFIIDNYYLDAVYN